MALYINTTKVGSTAYMGTTKLNKINFNNTEVWTGKIILPKLPSTGSYVRYAVVADDTIYLVYGTTSIKKFDGSAWVSIANCPYSGGAYDDNTFGYNNKLYVYDSSNKKVYEYLATSNTWRTITINTSYPIGSIGVYNNELYISLFTTLEAHRTNPSINQVAYNCTMGIFKLNRTSNTVFTPDSTALVSFQNNGTKSGVTAGTASALPSSVSFKFVTNTNEVYVTAAFRVNYTNTQGYGTQETYKSSILLPTSSEVSSFSNYQDYKAVRYQGKDYAYMEANTTSLATGKIKNAGEALSSFVSWNVPFASASNAVVWNNQLIFLGGRREATYYTIAQYDGNEWIVTS